MLNTTRLRILREIAARGSIASAAEALWLTPSAVSQAMSALEREVGVELLERTARSVRLTDAGTKLVTHAEKILADCEAAMADLEAIGGEVTGTVRVSAFPSAAQAVLVPALATLREAYPSLTVLASDLEPHESMPALKTGDLDVVISHEYSIMPCFSDPGIDRVDLLSEPMRVVLPASHPLAEKTRIDLAWLAGDRWIVGREATFCREVVLRAAQTAGFEPTVEMQCNDFRVSVAAVAAGLGVALVPRIADLSGLSGFVVRPLAEPVIERRIFAAVRKGSAGAPALNAVLDALKQTAEKIGD